MEIQFKLNGNNYSIHVDSNCYTAIKHGINADNGSKNFGNKTEIQMGYFTKLSNAALRCVREEISSADGVVSLKEFATRVEALNEQIKEQFSKIEI
jgi:hypothetical protein